MPDVGAVTRVRDEFMQIQGSLQHASLASLDRSNATLRQVQNVFGEPSDAGIGAQLSNLWSSWDAVANNPGDNGARSALLRQASAVASTINAAATSLRALKSRETDQLSTLVGQVNTTASSLARVNQSIKAGTLARLNVRQLEEQRDELADQLAKLAGGTHRTGRFNQMTVSIGDTNLVCERHAQPLTLDTSELNARLLARRGFTVSVTSGQAGAMLNDVNTVLPRYMADLDTVATTLRDQVNSAVSSFFTGTNALTLVVSADVTGNPAAVSVGLVGNGPLDNSVALALADTATSTTGADAAYNTMIVQLGANAKDVLTRENLQQLAVQSLDSARNAQAGVNTDEEMTNMVEYQRAYEASARFVPTLDSMLDTLIDMVGPQ